MNIHCENFRGLKFRLSCWWFRLLFLCASHPNSINFPLKLSEIREFVWSSRASFMRPFSSFVYVLSEAVLKIYIAWITYGLTTTF
jgi:hypothetical protein